MSVLRCLATSSLTRATFSKLLPSSSPGTRKKHSISLNNQTRNLEWRPHASSVRKELFPYVWLRDNCQCGECFRFNDRMVQLSDFPVDVQPKSAEISDSGGVEMVWEDGHRSTYPKKWLLARSFSEISRAERKERELEDRPVLWSSKDMQGKLPKHQFGSVMSDDLALMNWLEDLSRYGATLMGDVPVREGPVNDLQKRVNFERITHYGPGYAVEVRADPSNISHTYNRIGFHTDLTYYNYMAGTIFLHCIKQHEGDGGDTMLVDGFHAANILKEKSPGAYDLLTTTAMNFRDIGSDFKDFDKLNRTSIFVHDVHGDLKKISWSHFARDPHIDLPLEKIEEFYYAMKEYENILNDERSYIKHKMKPGELIAVKNTRIMHGRAELKGKLSARHLQCCYMDWDEIACKLRVLKKSFDGHADLG